MLGWDCQCTHTHRTAPPEPVTRTVTRIQGRVVAQIGAMQRCPTKYCFDALTAPARLFPQGGTRPTDVSILSVKTDFSELKILQVRVRLAARR
jgi:hypothetical protein